MTNEEALRILHCPSAYLTDEDSEFAHMIPLFSKAYGQAMAVAFEALKQADVLDKIRAEIENDWQLKKYPSSPFSCGLRRAIEIIDKYKAESEDEMTCDKCKYFKVLYEPLRTEGELWDMGRAKCDKHNLITDFANHGKFKRLDTCEDFESKAESEET